MEQVQLSISPAQMTKIRIGLPVQISHSSMGNGDVVVSLHPENARKMMSAFKRGKGLRIQMDEDEVRASGLLGRLKKLGIKAEKSIVDVSNKCRRPGLRDDNYSYRPASLDGDRRCDLIPKQP